MERKSRASPESRNVFYFFRLFNWDLLVVADWLEENLI